LGVAHVDDALGVVAKDPEILIDVKATDEGCTQSSPKDQ